jgi:microcompartment protein CcmL/EutN
MMTSVAFEALFVMETASIARGFLVLDAAVKRAPVTVRWARPVSPGRFVLVFGGSVEVTQESLEAARSAAGSDIVDEVYLPGVHPALLPAIDRSIAAERGEAVGIVETSTVASAIHAADLALKAVDVSVLRMHLALGTGGKGWFTICGPVGDVDAALEAVRSGVQPERIVGIELLAQPHPEIRGFLA